jgi:hypothetical protein
LAASITIEEAASSLGAIENSRVLRRVSQRRGIEQDRVTVEILLHLAYFTLVSMSSQRGLS